MLVSKHVQGRESEVVKGNPELRHFKDFMIRVDGASEPADGSEKHQGGLSSSQGSVKGGLPRSKEGGVGMVKEIRFKELDASTEDWLDWCAVGRLKESFDLSLIQFQLG